LALGHPSFATLECGLIERERSAAKSEALLSVFEFIEGWYNPDQLHSSIGYQSPQNYEEEYRSEDHSHSEEPYSPAAA
jgi:putative transposase